ncbi:bifunctional diguanylate cyclase/phosphodiesterase [Labrys wisconsinensis]|uniref:Diguanylate cyclase (GGDEF)-like protein/PAS domain S-box-containing protein n=1 Tax=Labrys wisconsinensis TaxID=425677 RepID=A0ABU0JG46_9HYPH|nr:EAL domain-containing protein [Labrys wisconsinensis]MDQ0473254.1 diguanylate cyclase (GGDEF)-like protein/PAS domain S-box-containing protein [Labrys wisconsinensis]
MFKVFTCVTEQHDLRLVALAALVCALSSFTAVTLLHHVRRSGGRLGRLWLQVAAAACGFGIWATHFIAMLAFSPGLPSGYSVPLTALSLGAAIALTGLGFAIALAKRLPAAAALGGAAVGGGIAAMHYTGMAAFRVAGTITWDPVLVGLSILLGGLLGAAALQVALSGRTLRWKLAGAALLTLAICGHHFTAMGAVSIMPDGTIAVPESALPPAWLAIAVAVASLAILLFAAAGLALDVDRHHAEREVERMRGLVNAAVEGLVVCSEETIITVNDSFAALVGAAAASLSETSLSEWFRDAAMRLRLPGRPGQAVETMLIRRDGSAIPVELILRPVTFAGRPHQAIAVRDLRERKKAEQHINFLAHHDALTGLPNRSSFNEMLDRAIETAGGTGRHLAVLCLDLDRFKEVNDLFGHAAGDELLQRVAACVTTILHDGETMARLGGDEFAVLAPDLAGPAAAGALAERILGALLAENEHSTTSAFVSSSIGIALYPDDASDRTGLLIHADTALYRAKNEGRCTYRFFEAAMGVQVTARRMIEHELRQALARQGLFLVYQPQTRVDSGETVGFEALVRWRNEAGEDVPPSLFIPIAEESGTILPIGEWVLRTACREAAGWSQPLGIAVNVSPVQIHNAGFARVVHEILLETGLTPQRLELEITETALIRDLNRALATLRQLKALGVRIAMDDFGTGYSSLSNLRAFPFDKIKIDGSFIKAVDSNDQAATIVRAVLGLGKGLGLPVLAEGVETPGELRFLNAEMCTEAQGYLLGRPARIEQFRHLTEGEARRGVHEPDRALRARLYAVSP